MEEDKNLKQNLDNSSEKLHISDVMNSVGEYPWLTTEMRENAKSNNDVDNACKYLRSCAAKKGYSLGINESFDVFDKHCS